MNGTLPVNPGELPSAQPEKVRIQILPEQEIEIRRNPSRRLPRQSQFYFQLVDHILIVKDNLVLRRSLMAHFDRLSRYHQNFVRSAPEVESEDS